jgi:hypothetical protein
MVNRLLKNVPSEKRDWAKQRMEQALIGPPLFQQPVKFRPRLPVLLLVVVGWLAWVNGAGAAGTGLVGYYYSNNTNNDFFTGLVATQTNATINFNWGNSAPATNVTADYFSIRWKGKLQPTNSGAYTLYLTSDDGSRLKVDNRVVIEGMTYQAATTRTAVLNLVSNQTYDLQIDYFDSTGGASCVFEWSGAGISRQVVPAAVLYPDTLTLSLAFPRTGWTPDAKKTVMLSASSAIATPSYQVKSNATVILSGPMTSRGACWGYNHYSADLTTLTNPGTYTIQVGQKSGTFDIAWDVHRNLRYNGGFTRITNIIASLYSYQRCFPAKCNSNGNRTHADYFNLPLYRQGTNESFVLQPGTGGDARGGWHDATSVDKETIEVGMTILDMAMAAERVTDPGDRAALLGEIRWGTDYLLTIQNPDGSWPLRVIPDNGCMEVINKNTGVAGKCSAALAAASVVLRDSDAAYANTVLAAATNAWNWIEANPNAFEPWTGWDGSAGNVLAAAVELARATGAQKYFDYAQTVIPQGGWSWHPHWAKSSGTFPGQIDDWYGQMREVYWAQTVVALARFYDIAPGPSLKNTVQSLCLSYVTAMKADMNNPFSAAENMFVPWFGFSQHLTHTAQCLLHVGVQFNNQEAIDLATRNYEFTTGFNPFGGVVACGFGEDPMIPLFDRPLTNTIGGVLPGFLYKDGVLTTDYLMMWDVWTIGETGLGSSATLDLLAMLDQRAATNSQPPPPLAPPSGLAARPWDNDIQLNWNTAPGATAYNLKRGTATNGPFTTLTNTTALAFADAGLTMGATYYYMVSSLNGSTETNSASVAITTRTNLALNKTATASSTRSGNAASRAVDGNSSTRWESAYSDPQWIQVDLGAIFDLDALRIYWEPAYATAYEIQVSTNASNWTTAYSTTSSPGGVEVFTNLTALNVRYVRINGTVRALPYGYSIWEFEIYGNSLPATVGLAGNPNPPSGAANVAVNPTLTWSAGANAISHRVYFGANSNAVATAATNSPEFKGALAATNYTSGTLASSGRFFWRVDEVGSIGSTNGLVWTFATAVNLTNRPVIGGGINGGSFAISFPSQIGQTYRVERTDSLNPVNWQTVSNNIPGTGSPLQILDTSAGASASRFYRSVILPP